MMTKRLLDKKISVSEKVADLPIEGQLLYTWLIPHADDLGLLQMSPRTIKATVIPMVDVTVKRVGELLEQMIFGGLLTVVKQGNKKYYCIENFVKNQRYREDIQPQTVLEFTCDRNASLSWKNLYAIYYEIRGIAPIDDQNDKTEREDRTDEKPDVTPAVRDVTPTERPVYITQHNTTQNNITQHKEDIPAEKQRPSPPETKRKPPDKQSPLERVCYFLEDELDTTIVNWPKQAKALKMMTDAGYSEKAIIYAIKYMSQDEYYDDKGFDLMTVANNIAHIKAIIKRKEKHVHT